MSGDSVASAATAPDTSNPHEDSQPSTTVEDVASAPTFAFATWKAELELMLQKEGGSVHECVQSLQTEFDERSQFIRGDFAWRKQATAFHDRLQDAITAQLGAFTINISNHATQVAESLARSLAKADHESQTALQQQEQKGEAALRRVRSTLAKEVERITRLEKCLRLEEARQAATILAQRECQLIAQHNERESHLQALLGDMRSSNESLETLNTQLLEALRTSRAELEQLRNTLVKSMSRPKRASSAASQKDNRNSILESSVDKNVKDGITRGLEEFPSHTNDLLLVPALRQSLSAATQTIGELKNRVSELENAQKIDKKQLREVQLSLSQAESEKAKATKLLGEARLRLIDNEKKLVEAAGESVRWQEKIDALEALSQGRERALADAQRLECAAREQVAVLTSRVQHLGGLEAQRREFEHSVRKWRESRTQEPSIEESSENDSNDLQRIVESYLQQVDTDREALTKLLESGETRDELKKRLEYGFEKRFGEQLNLRVSYERRRVLERLERLCAVEAKETQERSRRDQPSVTRFNRTESDFSRLTRLMKTAYDQLGICVGSWSETDLDGLHAQLESLKNDVQRLEQKLEDAADRAELQHVHLMRAQLAQQEKDLLLVELTARYRQLRATQIAWSTQQYDREQRKPNERKPLTVYGIPQPMVQNPKLHTLLQPPLRPRPASAAPCLASTTEIQNQQTRRSVHRVSLPSPSRLDARIVPRPVYSDMRNEEREEKAEDHIRSLMKSELLRPQFENHPEDAVGADGVLAILHRRRHRK